MPPPRTETWRWQVDARCRDSEPSTFFGSTDSEPCESNVAENAKTICTHCPVPKQCLAHALAVGEPFGVWGGMTEKERRQHKWFTYPSRDDA
ncbi:WhiB family transcriptional regulator [Rhodococcus fascians]|nr:WhiB family transcriptional regulator [Rhodococcus fascians]MBY3999516.1 WhiB family transcriptional regulator [Rhodococcus fascians]MBY4005049.1 WhiB family transcriptional regulator [Rhodococcus fascians]MBY4010078.1 WhiB family transcriptional regulator [Rhodococcus fascians]MBY4020256.1 WhiB family transcriptional regulator [Rhodococcus fascians]